jgi:hypothetical protein
MTRHLTWVCAICGETNECTDAACQCQLDAEDSTKAIHSEYIDGDLSYLEAVSRLQAIGEDEAERVVDEWADGRAIGECDACGKKRPLSRCWTTTGLETYACDVCRG